MWLNHPSGKIAVFVKDPVIIDEAIEEDKKPSKKKKKKK